MTEWRWPIRVYYEDTDASGVVYHAAYLRYFERARTEWLRTQGYSQERLRTDLGIAFAVADMSIEFRRPARLDDELTVSAAVIERRRASLVFAQELCAAALPEHVLTRAQVRVACVDVTRFVPRALPQIFAGPGAALATKTDSNRRG
jgi:acyl-CoA thioester hydrolase